MGAPDMRLYFVFHLLPYTAVRTRDNQLRLYVLLYMFLAWIYLFKEHSGCKDQT